MPSRATSPASFWGRAGLALGIALFTGLIVYHGVGEVAAALALAGWGLLALAAFHLLPLFLDAMGWRCLVLPAGRPRGSAFVHGRWLAESVNTLLPVMQIGGSVVRARFLHRRGVDGAEAGASVVVDMTLVVVSQVAFSLLGVLLLLTRGDSGRVGTVAATGALVMASLVGGFVVAQRRGMFGAGAGILERLTSRPGMAGLGLGARNLDDAIRASYARRGSVARSGAWHLASWVLGSGEVWLSLHFLATPVDMPSALLLESLGQAVRAAAFVVPGALGVQEGGYVVLGGALGLSPEVCLALSLSKRARELILGVPGLIAWQAGIRRSGDVPWGDAGAGGSHPANTGPSPGRPA